MTTSAGCIKTIADKTLPAPISDKVPYEMNGRIRRVSGGDNFEFVKSNRIHFVIIRGIDSPKAGQDFYQQAAQATRNMTRNKDVRIKVVDRDESMIEIAEVFVIQGDVADIQDDLNVGLELMRRGLAWFDGTELEDSELYRQAELEARSKKIGLWSEADPVPPWEFESAQQKKNVDRLKL